MTPKMTSTKPYLLRAFYEWIIDNDLTPYILANAEAENVMVPREFVNHGKIIFNISPGIVQALNMTNYVVEFDARFSGRQKHIYLPVSSVLAIYARENGRGTVFDQDDEDDLPPPEPNTPEESAKHGKKPKLRVIK